MKSRLPLTQWPETESDQPVFRLDRSSDEISRKRQRQGLRKRQTSSYILDLQIYVMCYWEIVNLVIIRSAPLLLLIQISTIHNSKQCVLPFRQKMLPSSMARPEQGKPPRSLN